MGTGVSHAAVDTVSFTHTSPRNRGRHPLPRRVLAWATTLHLLWPSATASVVLHTLQTAGAQPAPRPAAQRIADTYRRFLADPKTATLPAGHVRTRLPFRWWHGLIVVEAVIGGRSVPCILDTGAPETTWPEQMRLSGRRQGIRRPVKDWAGHTRDAEMVTLPAVSLGGYVLRNVPTWSVTSSEPPVTELREHTSVRDLIGRVPIIGNTLFERARVTIDGERREIIIESPPAEGASEQESEGTWLPITRGTTDRRVPRGHIYFTGSVNQRAMRFMLDSGYCHSDIWLCDSARETHALPRPYARRTVPTPFGTMRESWLPPLKWRIGGISWNGTARSGIAGAGAEAVIGRGLIEAARITIDYPGSRMYLQPRPRATRTSRQPAPGATGGGAG
jgi:predicted aspartyl protease